MPFNRPTPQNLLQRLQAEIDTELPGADARLRQTVEMVIARVVTMASHEMYGYLDWIARQVLVITAEVEELDRHGSTWNVPRKPATNAFGAIQFTGQNGTIVVEGTALQSASGIQYTTDADVTIAAGVGNVNVTAVEAGASGNAIAASKLRPLSPIAGLTADALVQADGLTGGNNTEADDDYRARILERIQSPPHGGSLFDYSRWAKEVPGVTRAWAYALQLGIGTVVVIFVMDNKVGTIIPSAGEVQTVQDYIDSVRPATADVTVVSPTAVPVDLEIHISPNTQAVKNAITAELQDFFRREAIPGGALLLSRINEAISTAAGEFDHVLVTPAANVTRAFGGISVLGTITWDAL